jgi:hypothetical protein
MAKKEIKIGDWIDVIARNVQIDAGEITGIDRAKNIVHYRSWDKPRYRSTAPLSYVFPFDVTRGL